MAVGKHLREEVVGKARLRLLASGEKIIGTVVGSSVVIEGDDQKVVWEALKRRAGEGGANYVGHDGARKHYLEHFPDGFESESYLEHERRYKMAAVDFLSEVLPLEAAIEGAGNGEAALSVFRKLNLLSQFEQMRVQDLFRSEDADSFIKGAARLASGDFREGLAQMTAAAKTHDAAKWTVVTYLPYLWRPQEHIFLKPTVSHDFAERIGHRFAHEYSSELAVETYEALLDMATETYKEIVDLGARDLIDVQSYIWIVGAYGEPATPADE